VVDEARAGDRQAARRRLQQRALVLGFVAMFASAPGQSFLIAVFVEHFLVGTGLSRTVFSTLYALATVVSAAGMIVLGRAADRFGLRAAWVVAALGLAAACGLASLASGALVAFLALAMLRTFGQGSSPLVGTLLVARWFGRRRGQAMAIATFGITAAAVALPPTVVALVVALGWRDAYRAIGLATLALLLPLALLVREPHRRGRRGPDEPAPDEAFPPALRRSRRLPRLEVPSRRAARLLVVLASPSLVMTAVVFHAVSVLGGRGLSLQQAGAVLALFGAASAVGTIAGGAVADRATTRLLLSLMSGLLAAAPIALLLPGAPTAVAAFVLMGLGGGVYGVVSGIVWARTYGLAQLGKLQGTSFSVQIAGAAFGPLPLALSLSATGSYVPGLAGLAAYALLALAAALGWRDPIRQPG
jgi:MFS family permease